MNERITREDYWNSFAENTGSYILWKQNLLKKYVGSGKRVLDVGCGDGTVGQVLAGKNELYGVDVSEIAIKKAEEKGYTARNFDLDHEIPFDEKFDVILLLDILEHVLYPEQLIKSSLRLMDEDSLMIVSVPNMLNLVNRIYFVRGRYVDIMDKSHKESRLFSDHIHVFSKRILEDLLSANNLRILEKNYYFPEEIGEKGWKRLQCIGDVIKKSGIYKLTPPLLSFGFLYICKKTTH